VVEYKILRLLVIPEEASSRFADLSVGEESRRIGGDRGNLVHMGYVTDGGFTALHKPILVTDLKGLSDDEAFNIADGILMRSYETIGIECVMYN